MSRPTGRLGPRSTTLMPGKIFTYDEAAAQIEAVRGITLSADARLRGLRTQLERAASGSRRAGKLKEWINTVIQNWAEEIESVGALPKGLWTVDFDSGAGYFFCWCLDEPSLAHYHHYHEGFAGRKPISELGIQDIPALIN